MSADPTPTNSLPRWPKVPRVITCLNCGGKGYVARIGGNGMKQPITCQGCGGSGKQEVK